MSLADRPKYSQSTRNPTFTRSANGVEMSLISSDCSSFVSSAVGAGGLKLKKNSEITSEGNMPTTESIINWYHNPRENNCFEIVKFNDHTVPIQMGDIYVNHGIGSHVIVVTSVPSETDPMGLTTITDAQGNSTTLPVSDQITAADCDSPNLLSKLARGGNGNQSQITTADNISMGPTISRYAPIDTQILKLACRGHFSSTDIKAFANDDGNELALFRIKHNPDGSIPEACKSHANITPVGYSAVQQCFANRP